MLTFQGIGLGGGIAIGRARVLRADHQAVPLNRVEAPDREAEVQRLHTAIDTAKAQLKEIAEHLPEDALADTTALIEVHRQMLDDVALGFAAQEKILDDGINAEWAWSQQIDSMVAQLQALNDEYLRERARDVMQIGQRVARLLRRGQSGKSLQFGAGEVVVAADIDPAELLKWRQAEGFAIDMGGVNSHTAIVARSLQRPSIIGLNDSSERIHDGQLVVLDAQTGELILDPTPEVLANFEARRIEQEAVAQRRLKLVHVPAVWRLKHPIQLLANIEEPEEAELAVNQGAEGVGLFRSEFLFLDRPQLPGEDEQYEAYCKALRPMQGRPVTIRTIDVGADKALPEQSSRAPANPALAERAIRFSLRHPEIFTTQLRALLRASAHGQLQILLPMLAHRFEVEAALQLIHLAREQLVREKQPIAQKVNIGAMIEVPAAAIEADWFAQQFDFLSIGTNDLVQYTLAVDRTDHTVANLYDSRHPAVLRLIQNTIDAGTKYHKPITVCGEMAGQPENALLLLGMGIRQLSMHSSALLPVKEAILADRAPA